MTMDMEMALLIQVFFEPKLASDEDSGSNCNVTESSGCTDVEYIGYIYFHTPIALIGVILNSLNLAVFTRNKFKGCGSTYTYLTALAVADLMTCLLAWPIGIMRCVPHTYTWQHYFREIYEIYIYIPIVNSFATASVWLTVIVSMERYFFISRPSASCLSSKKITKWAIAAISVCAFLINFPYFFHRTVSDTDQPNYTDWTYSIGYEVYVWCRLFLVKLIPILIIAVVNTLLGVKVCQANRRRKAMVFPSATQVRRQRMQIRTTAMLITISLIFIVCHALEPFIHSGLYTSIFGPCSTYTDTYDFWRMFINTLEIFSFATNFIVYCIFNKLFVAALRRLCKCGSNSVEDQTAEGSTMTAVSRKPRDDSKSVPDQTSNACIMNTTSGKSKDDTKSFKDKTAEGCTLIAISGQQTDADAGDSVEDQTGFTMNTVCEQQICGGKSVTLEDQTIEDCIVNTLHGQQNNGELVEDQTNEDFTANTTSGQQNNGELVEDQTNEDFTTNTLNGQQNNDKLTEDQTNEAFTTNTTSGQQNNDKSVEDQTKEACRTVNAISGHRADGDIDIDIDMEQAET